MAQGLSGFIGEGPHQTNCLRSRIGELPLTGAARSYLRPLLGHGCAAT